MRGSRIGGSIVPGAGWSCHRGKHRECCAGPPGAFARQCRCRRRSRPSPRCRARLCPRRRPPFHPRRRRRYHLRQPRHRYRLPRRRARERRCSRPRFASRPGAQASDSNYRVGDERPRDHSVSPLVSLKPAPRRLWSCRHRHMWLHPLRLPSRRRHRGRLRPRPPHAHIHFHTTAAITNRTLLLEYTRRSPTSGIWSPRCRWPDPAGGRTQAPGAIGEVLPRGYQLMVGYFELTEPTATAIDGGGGTPVTWAR